MEPDKLIDSALAEFCRAEPRAGLERRVMARVQADRNWRWFGWAGVAAGLAVAGLTVFVNLPTPAPERPAATHELVFQPVTDLPELPSRAKPARRQVAKRTQFPTPSPQTTEEKALLRMTTYYPELAKIALAPLSTDPIKIEPIQIVKLQDEVRNE